MKKVTFLLCLAVFIAVSCEKSEQNSQMSNISFTTCKQNILKSNNLANNVDVEFTNEGVQIMYYKFAVTCDFTTVNVTHTFENGVLNITQQGFPNQANCICYTDVSYTIEGISQNEVNVIFINSEQVYCYNNGNNQSDCDPNVIIDEEEYFNVPEFRDNISNMRIEGDNLKFTITASGCSGSSWIVKLITTGAYEKTLPPQRTLQLSFENREMCAAIVGREFSFNIECLQLKDYNQVQLNIAGKKILYEYGDNGNQTNCDRDVIISQTEYNNAPNHPVTIIKMNIESNCLKIKFGASGCNGDNWAVRLIDLGVVAESLPCQRTLRLSLNDIGECEAYFEKEMYFNIEDLQIQGNHSVQLNISGKSILYEY
ncbi:MAG: hypothetical protein LBI60_06685 [Bacteroidales bacterium]|jgi:hypothetical protein|nr:hypothetical protein [Bacteroidales bacterium]